ncbi:helix-turn-helix transcriptional regulator [Cellulomonas bogoriensis]|uniref:Transcriptional regulator n=1 Tax=Cellulomonas bogoriensis 69B4 = DSM 16987 TaxID=1386082 RepID=A0A0A0C0V1_9CELL|nr:transcriptional regulator [Cellulomonas bogoriensis]KGM13790.1 transcriptional regulator [Cellulomonas bogoriensis 69B4 = DSM 16987]
MADPTARALRLLSFLQAHRSWSGRELSDRLGVSARTLRRDVDRLRELGYDVTASPGTDGGYRLQDGGRLPPLLLEDEEAVAIAVALRVAAVALGEQTALSALVKLEQMLAPHLRRRVSALQEHAVPAGGRGLHVDADTVAELALACRDRERVRFGYVSALEVQTSRHVEPHTLVSFQGRWYLVCWDVDRADWRTFRADRMSGLLRTGVRVPARDLPVADPTEMVMATDTDSSHPLEAVVHLGVPLAEARRVFGVWATGASANAEGGTDWPIGGSTVADLVYATAWIPPEIPWSLTAAPEVREVLAVLGHRLAAASGGGAETHGPTQP